MGLESLAKGTSIKQRFAILNKYYSNQMLNEERSKLENYTTWRQRPTTVTEERFQDILADFQLTKEEFDFAIKKLTVEEQAFIFEAILNDSWVQTTQQIFAEEDRLSEDVFKEETANFTYALRLHIDYVDLSIRKILNEFPEINVQEQAITEFVGEIINRFMDISLRTFVYDLHEKKEMMSFPETADEKVRFQEFLVGRFYKKSDVIEFFCDYPVLARLCAETIEFQLENFRELLQAIVESKEELAQIFQVVLPVEVKGIKMGAGDSHDKGKSVAILTFSNDIEVVFKPKNLAIGQRFDHFVQEIKQLEPRFDFYLTTKIVEKNYTFEERLRYSSCQTEEEVIHYYRQFGHTIALVYLLNGNDFHLENVLAFGKYPVLIDLETIIQNHFPLPNVESALVKVMQNNGESVVMSGLVPIYLFEEKAEEDVEGASKGIQLSALSGGEQKLPYKVLKLINFDSDNMQFVYQEHITDAAENIPLFKGEKVDFVPYIDEIIAGFKEFSTFARHHNNELADLAKEIFSNVLVRNVIKTTQSYGDLLDYSTHPSCMVDYIEREKLFENLWMHGYSSAKPVPYEVRDMLQHDVPIFFNPTNTCDLVASQGEILTNVYQDKAIDLERERLVNFSIEEEKEQLDYLKTSFGLYHSMDLQEQKIEVINPSEEELFLEGAIAVGEAILSKAFIGEESIAWKDVEETTADNYIVNVMNENFYDGITGMYLFFSELYFATKDARFKEPYELAQAHVLKLETEYVDSISAFYGSFAAVYPLLITFGYSGDSRLLTAAENIAKTYMERYDANTVESYDWNGGTASIVKGFIHLYQVTKNEQYLSFAKQLLMDIKVHEIHQGGFAHGYAGVIHAANSVLKQEADKKEAAVIIQQCLTKERATFDSQQQGWLDTRMNPPMINDLWCYGATGIGMAYLDLVLSGFKDEQLINEIQVAAKRLLGQEKINDCLCHGSFSDLEFLTAFGQTDYATPQQKEQIQGRIDKVKEKVNAGTYTFEGLPTIPKQGLFTGLAGIGHQLLRLYDPEKAANLLLMELPTS
ncbi:type 2 lanthipeptide synthetase LanM [Enterococcus rivorum]|uniref:Lantibiotic biosynthesis protein n=1 Tax=Enterococcus rivorum TaxID=762845 RepID=A0A1E5KY89_9ENTE|nr:type 2 lanthipeptide synthetase LanM [Enterococcus rivorum]MBP2100575.1 type 2 lantibiotic biosynthesis protein LanM [Enterococcus rivorum]OEH82852.1 lantibiotic biosynthesis protein [Enterococcus rivorum]